MKKSKFLRLNQRDFWRGLIVTLCSGAVPLITSAIADWHLDSQDWEIIGMGLLSVFFGYIATNLFTNSEGRFRKEPTANP